MPNYLEKARKALQEKRQRGEEPERLDPKQKAKRKPNSKALAIAAMCFQCMGEEKSYRADIRNCTAKGCSLYPHRPFQTTEERLEKAHFSKEQQKKHIENCDSNHLVDQHALRDENASGQLNLFRK